MSESPCAALFCAVPCRHGGGGGATRPCATERLLHDARVHSWTHRPLSLSELWSREDSLQSYVEGTTTPPCVLG